MFRNAKQHHTKQQGRPPDSTNWYHTPVHGYRTRQPERLWRRRHKQGLEPLAGVQEYKSTTENKLLAFCVQQMDAVSTAFS